jgi:cytidylate kinase
MYRALALAAIQRHIPWDEPERIADLAAGILLDLDSQQVRVDGVDVTAVIRASEVTASVYHVADSPLIRERLVAMQRRAAAGGNVVTEGRDQGTVVFPQAECKIFLTASPEERARRRLGDLRARGEDVTLPVVLKQQNERDERDRDRPVGRLVPAADAIEVNTDGMSPTAVLDRLEAIVRECRAR